MINMYAYVFLVKQYQKFLHYHYRKFLVQKICLKLSWVYLKIDNQISQQDNVEFTRRSCWFVVIFLRTHYQKFIFNDHLTKNKDIYIVVLPKDDHSTMNFLILTSKLGVYVSLNRNQSDETYPRNQIY